MIIHPKEIKIAEELENLEIRSYEEGFIFSKIYF